MRPLALVAILALAGCTPENGPTMRPGDDCLRCHGGSPGGTLGGERPAPRWTLAGTVYATINAEASAGVEGAQVQVKDAKGFSFTLETNLAGNFYTAESVTFPLTVCVARHGQVNCMDTPVQHGACNYCHAVPARAPPLEDAGGRIAAP